MGIGILSVSRGYGGFTDIVIVEPALPIAKEGGSGPMVNRQVYKAPRIASSTIKKSK